MQQRIVVILIVLTVVAISILLSLHDIMIIPLVAIENKLREMFIYYSYNTANPISALVPAIVNAIIWDFRGIDTFYETVVLFTSIISLAVVYYNYSNGLDREALDRVRLSPIAMTVFRIVIPIAIAIAISLAINGHRTPGGGFQGGAVVAAIVAIGIAIYSAQEIYIKQFEYSKLISIRSIGLLAIIVTAMIPVIRGYILGSHGYIFQNQYKPGAIDGISYYIDGVRVSGILPIYNILEMVIVATSFILVLMLLYRRY